MGWLYVTTGRRAWLKCLGLLLLASLVAGCGKPSGKLSGRVLLDGSPLPGGRVTFRPADPKFNPVVVDLDEEGNYAAALPVGEVQVSVDNRELEPRAKPIAGSALNLPPQVREAMNKAKAEGVPAPKPDASPIKTASPPAKARGKYVAIPPKYYTLENSGLQVTVAPGDHKQDIELKSGR